MTALLPCSFPLPSAPIFLTSPCSQASPSSIFTYSSAKHNTSCYPNGPSKRSSRSHQWPPYQIQRIHNFVTVSMLLNIISVILPFQRGRIYLYLNIFSYLNKIPYFYLNVSSPQSCSSMSSFLSQ